MSKLTPADYEFVIPRSGGKAGRGHNVTGSVQVRQDSMIVRQFRFKVRDQGSLDKAMEKARTYVREATK